MDRLVLRKNPHGWLLRGPFVMSSVGGTYSVSYDTGVKLFATFEEAIIGLNLCLKTWADAQRGYGHGV